MKSSRHGFTLVELLVVIAILALLLSLMAPLLAQVRSKARRLQGIHNQKNIVMAVTIYAVDNEGKYPASVATIGSRGSYWNWLEPTTMITYWEQFPMHNRSISAYLSDYIDDAATMYCPNIPRKYPYMSQAWQAGDNWDNPETARCPDPLFGSYSFYWGYIGHLKDRQRVFQGPRRIARGRGQSKLLLSDFFGYDNWRCRDAYISCEKFSEEGTVARNADSSDYWYCLKNDGTISLDALEIRLYAGYTDGHVDDFSSSDVTTMQVSSTPNGKVPHEFYGDFYLPRK